MSTGKRNLRQVVDAGIDVGGGSSQNEQPDASIMVGFTTRTVQYYQQFSTSTNLFYIVYSIYLDSNNNFPEKDGITVGPGANANWSFSQSNVGFRHYHQQMQAMKGRNVAGDEGSSPPSGDPSGIVAAGGGNGTYKVADISLGNMRGFKYHTSFLGTHPSTLGGTTEHLFESLEVSIGSTS